MFVACGRDLNAAASAPCGVFEAMNQKAKSRQEMKCSYLHTCGKIFIFQFGYFYAFQGAHDARDKVFRDESPDVWRARANGKGPPTSMAAAMASSCPLCGNDLHHLGARAQQSHVGRCRVFFATKESSSSSSVDGGDEQQPIDEEARMQVVAADMHDEVVPHDVDAAYEGVHVASHFPFPSEADAQLAAMYTNKFGLSIGTLDAILAITRRGDVHARSTRELLGWVDQLPGMDYQCAECTIPGYPLGVYRIFYRPLQATVHFLVRRHAAALLRPSLLPCDEDGVVDALEELWQGKRYQEVYRQFREEADPTDVLLPLIFFSGVSHASMPFIPALVIWRLLTVLHCL